LSFLAIFRSSRPRRGHPHSKFWKVVEQKLFLMSVRNFLDYSSRQFLNLKFSRTKTLQPMPILQNFWSIEYHHDQNCNFFDFIWNLAKAKNNLRAKTFPTSPNMWRLVAWNLDFPADSGKYSKWKIFIPRLKPVKDIKGIISKFWACSFVSDP
jgi:hypothetical protein